MGIYTVPNLKDEAVVCQAPCKHEKCAAIREEWTDAKCHKCGKLFQAGDLLVYSEEAAKSWKERHECIGCAFEGGQNEGYQTAGQCRS